MARRGRPRIFTDPTRRAVSHPVPSAGLCQMATSRGSVAFHVRDMSGLAAKSRPKRSDDSSVTFGSGTAAASFSASATCRSTRTGAHAAQLLESTGSLRQRDDNSRGRVPNVRGDSSADQHAADVAAISMPPATPHADSILYILMCVEWDARKAASNRRKHGVSFQEATTTFADGRALEGADLQHSGTEPRFRLVGRSPDGPVLVVVYTLRRRPNGEEAIRIISARRANRQERASYATD